MIMSEFRMSLLLLACAIGASVAVPSPARSTAIVDEHWSQAFSRPGVEGSVRAVACAADGRVYVGGSFTQAGGIPAANVAMWDGVRWTALGEGIDGDVCEMVIGPHGNLYATWNFPNSGYAPATHLSMWDGAAWSALGNGFECRTVSLCVDANGDLYIGGTFLNGDGAPFPDIAKWDGTTWSWPCPGVPHPARQLAVDDSGNVYALYSYIAGPPDVWYCGVVRWDGSAWTTLANALGIASMVVDKDGGLCVGGSFATVGGVAAAGVARWDGTTWTSLGAGPPSWVDAMAVGADGRLWAVCRSWISPGNIPYASFFAWDGSTWSTGAPGMQGEVGALAVDGSGDIYAGGSFAAVGGVLASGIASWDGASWSAFGTGNGLDGPVCALAADGQGNVYAGGDFTAAGGSPASHIAKWNGAAWTALGTGLNGRVNALVVTADGIVYAGGEFTMSGGATTGHVARWDGTAWTALGNLPAGDVNALALGIAGDLYIGGRFGTPYPFSPYYGVVRWDGATCTRVGATAWADNCYVHSIAVDTSGNVYANATEGTCAMYEPAHNVLKWDGATWSQLGTTWSEYYCGGVGVLAVDGDGNLYAGGAIFRDYSLTVCSAYLAKWDGVEWSSPDGWTEPEGSVNLLATDAAGHLMVGGNFAAVDGIPASCLTRWDGSAWSSFGSGLNGTVRALAVDSRGRLAVGGEFTHAGTWFSSNFGVWTEPTAAPVAPLSGPPNTILHPAAPNPFNPRTTVRFDLPDAAHVRLAIHDVRGRLIRTLVDAEFARGAHGIDWNGRDEQGADVASGSYFALIDAGERREVMPLTLVK
jgi:hypothetical protein